MSTLSSLALWSFLPSLLSSWLLWFYYGVRSTFWRGYRRPEKGSAKAIRNQKWSYTLLLTIYFATSVYQAYHPAHQSDDINQIMSMGLARNNPAMAGDAGKIWIPSVSSSKAYATFDLNPATFSQRALKSAFRKLSLQFHPDKRHMSQDTKDLTEEEAGDIFLLIRKRYEMLNDPMKRRVLSVLGEEAVDACSPVDPTQANQKQYRGVGCRTTREYFWNGVLNKLAFYVGIGTMFGVIQLVSGRGSDHSSASAVSGSTLRWICLLMLFAFEWTCITHGMSERPSSSGWMRVAVTSTRTLEEWIEISHSLFLAISMYISHTVPVWTAPAPPSSFVQELETKTPDELMTRLNQMQTDMREEVVMGRQMAVEPFLSSDGMKQRLRSTMSRLASDLRLFNEPSFQQAYDRVRSAKRAPKH